MAMLLVGILPQKGLVQGLVLQLRVFIRHQRTEKSLFTMQNSLANAQ